MSRLGDYLNLTDFDDCSGNKVFNVSERYDQLAAEPLQPISLPVREDFEVDKKFEFIKVLQTNNGQYLNDWIASNIDNIDLMPFLLNLRSELQSHITKIDEFF